MINYIYTVLKVTAIGIFSLLLLSCEEVIDLNLSDDTPRVVIEGGVTSLTEPYSVNLSWSKSYYSSEPQETISDALVIISDDRGVVDTLVSVGEGEYRTVKTVGEVGRGYTLSTEVDGVSYIASSYLNSPIAIDSISVNWTQFEFWELSSEEQSEGEDDEEGYRVSVSFLDKESFTDYILFKLKINGEYISDIYLYNDTFTDGNYQEYIFYGYTDVETNDTVSVEAWTLTEDAYNFFNTSDDVIIDGDGGGGSMGAAPPDNPVSNISNGALGYFSAHGVSISDETVAKREE